MPRPDPVVELVKTYSYHAMDRELRPIAVRLSIRKHSIVRLLNVLDETIWAHPNHPACYDYVEQLRAHKGFGRNSYALLEAWSLEHGVPMKRAADVRAHINPEKLDALLEAWQKRERARATAARSLRMKDAHEHAAGVLTELRKTLLENA